MEHFGGEFDILPQKRRDPSAAERFFKRVLRSCPGPRKIVTHQLHCSPAAKAEIPELAKVKHVFVKAAAGLNNRAENSHQPTRERQRRLRGFRDPARTQAFLSSFRPIRQHFALKRHFLRASLYRKRLAMTLPQGGQFNATKPWHAFGTCGTPRGQAGYSRQCGLHGNQAGMTLRRTMANGGSRGTRAREGAWCCRGCLPRASRPD